MDLQCHPEVHLTTSSEYHQQFTDMSHLYASQCNSNGDRPFICTNCSKGFRYVSDLRKHALIHTGERPFRCATCNKQFTQLCNMRRHELIHTSILAWNITNVLSKCAIYANITVFDTLMNVSYSACMRQFEIGDWRSYQIALSWMYIVKIVA